MAAPRQEHRMAKWQRREEIYRLKRERECLPNDAEVATEELRAAQDQVDRSLAMSKLLRLEHRKNWIHKRLRELEEEEREKGI